MKISVEATEENKKLINEIKTRWQKARGEHEQEVSTRVLR
jgi:hypothetical protein